MTTFSIVPDAAFSLAAAASFGFGPHTGRPKPTGGEMRLAFVTDDLRHHAAVHLTQDENGTVIGTADTDANAAAVCRQVGRILSLDHSGREWLKIGEQDPIVGALQSTYHGLRPVLFHSPYEAAAWSIIAAHRQRTQAATIRTRLAAALGRTFTLAGEQIHAFPLPEQILNVDTFPGLDVTRITRLHAVARAALAGALQPEGLLGLETDQALEHLKRLPGIGPTYAGLILLRATGATDVMSGHEPRLPSYVAHFYDLAQSEATIQHVQTLAERWRPFRTWTAVLIRVAGDRLNLPLPDRHPQLH